MPLTLGSHRTEAESPSKYAVIDTDVHPDLNMAKPEVVSQIPQRWREYIAEYGLLRAQGPIVFERHSPSTKIKGNRTTW